MARSEDRYEGLDGLLGTTRRVTTNSTSNGKLKQIAGMIQSLSYREMLDLAEEVSKELPGALAEETTQALLAASDKILERKN